MLGPVKALVRRILNQRGYYKIAGLGTEICSIEDFRAASRAIRARYLQQTEDQVAALKKKYEEPIFGEVPLYHLLELLAQVIDPHNAYLYCGSQLCHTLQVLESMEKSGVTDREMLAVTLIHDLGMLPLLKGEPPEFVEGGGKVPLRSFSPGIGLANGLYTFDHSDIVYARLKPYLSDHMAWLLRWHSIQKECLPLLDETDRLLYEKVYRPFIRHDQCYTFYHRPVKQLSDCKGLLDEFFPEKILF